MHMEVYYFEVVLVVDFSLASSLYCRSLGRLLASAWDEQ